MTWSNGTQYCLADIKDNGRKYRQTSNINHALVANKIVDHSDVVGACSNYIFILNLTPYFNGLGKRQLQDETINI